jgi:hypothetical protein
MWGPWIGVREEYGRDAGATKGDLGVYKASKAWRTMARLL